MTTLIPQLFNNEPWLNDVKLGRRQVVQEEVRWKDIQNKPVNLATTDDIQNTSQNLEQQIHTLQWALHDLERRVQALENNP